MSRRRKGHGCGITVLVLLFIFILAGGGLGVLFARKYMPSNELADKSRIFGIKDGQVALILDNQVQEEKGIYEGGQVYLPVDWVNEHLNERFYWDEGENCLCMHCLNPLCMRMKVPRARRDLSLRSHRMECTCPLGLW